MSSSTIAGMLVWKPAWNVAPPSVEIMAVSAGHAAVVLAEAPPETLPKQGSVPL